jgi:hypothetical protein
MRSFRILTAILATVLAAAPAVSMAQTPDDACAADSLYLVSPDAVDIYLQERGRLGMVVSWPTLDLSEATCFTLRGDETLGFTPEVVGGFGDQVDRVLTFTAADTGQVGAPINRNILVNWQTSGSTVNGYLAGILNLANNGGVLRWDDAAGDWLQVNDGLPNSLRQTNVVAYTAAPNGEFYVGLTAGQSIDAEPRGLYRFDGQSWSRVAPDVFDASRRVTAIAVDGDNPANIAVGTALSGLFVSNDGGVTFRNWQNELDPDNVIEPPYYLTALLWNNGKLLACMANMGVFASTDGGASFSRVNFLVPADLDGGYVRTQPPLVNQLAVDPANPSRILAALFYHGVYESTDGGVTWNDKYGDLLVPQPGNSGAWLHTAQSVTIDPQDPDVLLMGVLQRGLYRTADNGSTWTLVGGDLQPSNTGALTRIMVAAMPDQPGRMYALEDKWGLLESSDGGQTWQFFAEPWVLNTAMNIHPLPGGGDFLVFTWGGGIYEAGASILLKDTYTAATTPALRNLDLGLSLTVGGGRVERNDAFALVCQTFQGWAVWRAPAWDQDEMTLVGLFDRVNPESCIEGYCGDVAYDPVPLCFAAKRAACFDMDTPDTVRFFDDEVYNGFSYYYSVTAFDYGNTAGVSPASNDRTLIFSPRWEGDAASPFVGEGNRSYVQANLSAVPAESGDVIYVYPNPLRLNSGVPGEDGRTVIWTNLPPGSRVRVFTTAGDDVANLGPELQVGGQIRWTTENRESEPVSAGVYIYKVEMVDRDPFFGRLAIIR